MDEFIKPRYRNNTLNNSHEHFHYFESAAVPVSLPWNYVLLLNRPRNRHNPKYQIIESGIIMIKVVRCTLI